MSIRTGPTSTTPPSSDPAGIEVRPVTPDRWDDLLRVFGPNGARAGCWCMVWRLSSTELRRLPAGARRERLEALVAEGTPTGLLAYVDGDPVGWCSIGPRETFGRLVRSRTLPPPDEQPAWAITCFYVRAGFRRRGIASALVHGAVAHAAESGAAALDGFGGRNTADKPASSGGIGLFRDAGFHETPSGSTYYTVMRRLLGRSPGEPAMERMVDKLVE